MVQELFSLIYTMYIIYIVRFEPSTTEFHSGPGTDWSVRPWGHFALKANFVRLFQFHIFNPWFLNLLNSCLSWTLGSLSQCSLKKGLTLVEVHLNWLNWFHFVILKGGLLVILINCMIFLSLFLDVKC